MSVTAIFPSDRIWSEQEYPSAAGIDKRRARTRERGLAYADCRMRTGGKKYFKIIENNFKTK
jgi:TnpA family transposase